MNVKTIAAVGLLLGAVVLSGCGEETESAKSDVAAKTEQMTNDAGEAVGDMVDQAMDQKDAYVSLVKGKLDAMDERLEDLQAKSDKLGVQAKTLLEKPMEQLVEKQDIAKAKFEDLKSAGDDWTEKKADMDGALGEAEKALGKVMSLF